MAYFLQRTGQYEIPVIIPLDKDEVVVGRKTHEQLSNAAHVSRLHGSFQETSDGQWFIKDLNSMNGIYVNGIRIGRGLYRLNINDSIGLGVPQGDSEAEFVFIFRRNVQTMKVERLDDDNEQELKLLDKARKSKLSDIPSCVKKDTAICVKKEILPICIKEENLPISENEENLTICIKKKSPICVKKENSLIYVVEENSNMCIKTNTSSSTNKNSSNSGSATSNSVSSTNFNSAPLNSTVNKNSLIALKSTTHNATEISIESNSHPRKESTSKVQEMIKLPTLKLHKCDSPTYAIPEDIEHPFRPLKSVESIDNSTIISLSSSSSINLSSSSEDEIVHHLKRKPMVLSSSEESDEEFISKSDKSVKREISVSTDKQSHAINSGKVFDSTLDNIHLNGCGKNNQSGYSFGIPATYQKNYNETTLREKQSINITNFPEFQYALPTDNINEISSESEIEIINDDNDGNDDDQLENNNEEIFKDSGYSQDDEIIIISDDDDYLNLKPSQENLDTKTPNIKAEPCDFELSDSEWQYIINDASTVLPSTLKREHNAQILVKSATEAILNPEEEIKNRKIEISEPENIINENALAHPERVNCSNISSYEVNDKGNDSNIIVKDHKPLYFNTTSTNYQTTPLQESQINKIVSSTKEDKPIQEFMDKKKCINESYHSFHLSEKTSLNQVETTKSIDINDFFPILSQSFYSSAEQASDEEMEVTTNSKALSEAHLHTVELQKEPKDTSDTSESEVENEYNNNQAYNIQKSIDEKVDNFCRKQKEKTVNKTLLTEPLPMRSRPRHQCGREEWFEDKYTSNEKSKDKSFKMKKGAKTDVRHQTKQTSLNRSLENDNVHKLQKGLATGNAKIRNTSRKKKHLKDEIQKQMGHRIPVPNGGSAIPKRDDNNLKTYNNYKPHKFQSIQKRSFSEIETTETAKLDSDNTLKRKTIYANRKSGRFGSRMDFLTTEIQSKENDLKNRNIQKLSPLKVDSKPNRLARFKIPKKEKISTHKTNEAGKFNAEDETKDFNLKNSKKESLAGINKPQNRSAESVQLSESQCLEETSANGSCVMIKPYMKQYRSISLTEKNLHVTSTAFNSKIAEKSISLGNSLNLNEGVISTDISTNTSQLNVKKITYHSNSTESRNNAPIDNASVVPELETKTTSFTKFSNVDKSTFQSLKSLCGSSIVQTNKQVDEPPATIGFTNESITLNSTTSSPPVQITESIDQTDSKHLPNNTSKLLTTAVLEDPRLKRKNHSASDQIKKRVTFSEPPRNGHHINPGRYFGSAIPPNISSIKSPRVPPTPPFTKLTIKVNLNTILLEILAWNPLWLKEYETILKPPPSVIKGVKPLKLSYQSLDNYVMSYYRLFLIETWETLYRAWKDKKNNDILLTVTSYSVDGDLMILECQSILSCNTAIALKEGNLLIVDLRNQGNHTVVIVFGYIYELKKGLLRPGMEDLDVKLTMLPAANEHNANFYKFCMKTKKKPVSLDMNKIMKATVLYYLKPNLRIIDALSHLSSSILVKDILVPRVTNCSVSPQIHAAIQANLYNESQTAAIVGISDAVLKPYPTTRIILLQGPPGTGKTHTILGIIQHVLSKKQEAIKVLVTAPSNAAVDEIGRRLIALRNKQKEDNVGKVNFVRVGHQIHSEVLPYSLDELVMRLAEKKCRKEEEKVDSSLSEVEAKINSLEHKVQSMKSRKMPMDVIKKTEGQLAMLIRRQDRAKEERQNLRQKILNCKDSEKHTLKLDILQNADVILSTLSSCRQSILETAFSKSSKVFFTCCIVDEATQCTEPEVLQPLMFGMSKLILVGDHHQLPATVYSKTALENKFYMSLYERIYLYFMSIKQPSPVIMLTEQYRMHSEICNFPSKYFYSRKLTTAKNVDSKYRSFPLRPYKIVNILDGQESNASSSKANEEEALVTIHICKNLVTFLPKHTTIGIITPYQAQRQLYLKAFQMHFDCRDIEVNTVDGFQGREKDVIILSCVRARSASGSIGFLADKKRLNVAITRARKCLIICGHIKSLQENPDWNALITDAEKRKLCVPITALEDIPFVVGGDIKKED